MHPCGVNKHFSSRASHPPSQPPLNSSCCLTHTRVPAAKPLQLAPTTPPSHNLGSAHAAVVATASSKYLTSSCSTSAARSLILSHAWPPNHTLPACQASSSSNSSRDVKRKSMAGSSGGAPGNGNPLAEVLAGLSHQLHAMAEAQARAEQEAKGAAGAVSVRGLTFHPPGSEAPLIKDVSMDVDPNTLGLIIGRSGSGKTTLLQVLAGLCEQTSGEVRITPAKDKSTAPPLSLEARMDKVGLVFQFPERHFLGSDIFSELTFTWPRDPAFFMQQQVLRSRVEKVLRAVRLDNVSLSRSPWELSGGQQRRLALAIQLIRQPALLLLDEPLAGLDWEARVEVVELLQQLKGECTLLVVSHDLREIAPLVDQAWNMKLGGTIEPVQWPPPHGTHTAGVSQQQQP